METGPIPGPASQRWDVTHKTHHLSDGTAWFSEAPPSSFISLVLVPAPAQMLLVSGPRSITGSKIYLLTSHRTWPSWGQVQSWDAGSSWTMVWTTPLGWVIMSEVKLWWDSSSRFILTSGLQMHPICLAIASHTGSLHLNSCLKT